MIFAARVNDLGEATRAFDEARKMCEEDPALLRVLMYDYLLCLYHAACTAMLSLEHLA